MTLRTDPELDKALEIVARALGVSKQEAAKQAILARAEELRHRADVESATEAVIQRWGDVLDRLGRA